MIIYPNKFQLIRDPSEVKGDGLYYINDKISDEMIPSIKEWISYTLSLSYSVPAGEDRGSISSDKFYDMYKTDIFDLNHLRVSLSNSDSWYEQGLNPITTRTIGDESFFIIWGDKVILREFPEVQGIRNISMVASILTVLHTLLHSPNWRTDIIKDLQYLKNEDFLYDFKTTEIGEEIFIGMKFPQYKEIVLLSDNFNNFNFLIQTYNMFKNTFLYESEILH